MNILLTALNLAGYDPGTELLNPYTVAPENWQLFLRLSLRRY